MFRWVKEGLLEVVMAGVRWVNEASVERLIGLRRVALPVGEAVRRLGTDSHRSETLIRMIKDGILDSPCPPEEIGGQYWVTYESIERVRDEPVRRTCASCHRSLSD